MSKTNERTCPHCDGLIGECGGQTFVKAYECQDCLVHWREVWCCACNDRCPNCDTETTPYEVVEVQHVS